MKQLNYNVSEIENIARQIWSNYNRYKCWAFEAPMGAGKTTLIHALCDVLKVEDAVGSPTFAIINEYRSPVAGVIYHMDWYRIKDEMEAIQAGCEDCIDSGNLCFIEWPEKFPDLLPDSSLHISITIENDHERKIVIDALS